MRESVEITNKTVAYTKEMYCYGHRRHLPITRFDKSMIGKPRAHCLACMEGRKANVKAKTTE